MSKFTYPIALCIAFMLCGFKPGEPNISEFIGFIQQFNISKVWTEQEVIAEKGQDTILRPKSTGSFGERGIIMETHFMNVFKDTKDPYLYRAFGKMKIGNTIVDFQGTMKIEEAKLYDETLAPKYKQGYVKGPFEFQIATGPYQGDMSGRYESFFIWGSNYEIHYDGLNLGSEDYANNIFSGKWVSSKKANTVSDFRFQDAIVRNPLNYKNNTTPPPAVDKWWE